MSLLIGVDVQTDTTETAPASTIVKTLTFPGSIQEGDYCFIGYTAHGTGSPTVCRMALTFDVGTWDESAVLLSPSSGTSDSAVLRGYSKLYEAADGVDVVVTGTVSGSAAGRIHSAVFHLVVLRGPTLGGILDAGENGNSGEATPVNMTINDFANQHPNKIHTIICMWGGISSNYSAASGAVDAGHTMAQEVAYTADDPDIYSAVTYEDFPAASSSYGVDTLDVTMGAAESLRWQTARYAPTGPSVATVGGPQLALRLLRIEQPELPYQLHTRMGNV